VRKTGALASGKYYGRHLKKIQIAISPRTAADHPIPIYSMFGSRTGFSWSADRIALFPVSPNSIGMREKQCASRGVATGVDIGIYTPKISPSKLFMG